MRIKNLSLSGRIGVGIILALSGLGLTACAGSNPSSSNDGNTQQQQNRSPVIENLAIQLWNFRIDKWENIPISKEMGYLHQALLKCSASDPDDDDLTFFWSCTGGRFNNTYNWQVLWDGPSGTPTSNKSYTITVEVLDPYGLSARRSVSINVVTNPYYPYPSPY
ncbi:hypothetical protein J4405_06070 [Candidatus Woesearchaeota archaeon]|nr:hypothetical protein [Candidatus Woesearchaeota archaeon]